MFQFFSIEKHKEKPKAPRWFVIANFLGLIGFVGYKSRHLMIEIYEIHKKASLENKEFWAELKKKTNENLTAERLVSLNSHIKLFNIESFDGSISDKIFRLFLNSPILFKCDGDRDPKNGEWNPAKEETERDLKLTKYWYYKQSIEELEKAEKEEREEKEKKMANETELLEISTGKKPEDSAPEDESSQSDNNTSDDVEQPDESDESELSDTTNESSEIPTAYT